MTNKPFFSRQLATWLLQYDWHYTTLLAATIQHTNGIPEHEDDFVNALLKTYPQKPDQTVLSNFIQTYFSKRKWFNPNTQIVDICIDQPQLTAPNISPLPVIQNSKELASFLNISENELDWFSQKFRRDKNQADHLNHYHYSLHKKSDGDYRLLESPKTRLKSIQQRISEKIISLVKVHSAAHGFVKGKSCKTHAANHTGKRFLFVFDLQQCFQSTQWYQIYRVFDDIGYSKSISQYLSHLSTHQCYVNHPALKKFLTDHILRLKTKHLPQGAPGSPALSNLVLYHLDKRLTGLAKRLQLTYSRYADDLAFSGNHRRCWKFLEPLVGAICLEEGFQLNHRKSRILKSAQRQKLTGIVVNQKTNIDRRYYDRLKAILHNCQRYGLRSQNRLNLPNFRAYLLGSIQYVKSLNPDKGEKLLKLFQQIT